MTIGLLLLKRDPASPPHPPTVVWVLLMPMQPIELLSWMPDNLDLGDHNAFCLNVELSRILCGASAYPRIIDFGKFKEIADEAWRPGLSWQEALTGRARSGTRLGRERLQYPSVCNGID